MDIMAHGQKYQAAAKDSKLSERIDLDSLDRL